MMNNSTLNNAYLQVLQDDAKATMPVAEKTNRLESLIQQYRGKTNPTKQDVIDLFNIALMDEYLAEYNYFASYNLSKTDGKADYDPEFQQHEDEQRGHRKDIVNRLRELEAPVPVKLWQEYPIQNSAGEDWKQELETDSNKIIMNRYQEELGAIKFYSMFFEFLKKFPESERDTTSEMLVKHLKADEQAHAKDLRDLAVEHGLMEPNTDATQIQNQDDRDGQDEGPATDYEDGQEETPNEDQQ